MNRSKLHKSALIMLVMLLGILPTSSALMQSTALVSAFTYQGFLSGGSGAVNGSCDMQFSLYSAASGGVQIGSSITQSAIPVSNGVFNVLLDFGSAAFDGTDRYLQVAVRCPAGSGSFTTLSTRQALTATPYAIYANHAAWSGLTGVPPGFADGVDDNTIYSAGAGVSLSSSSFSLLPGYQLPQACTNGQIPQWNGSAWACAADANTTYSAGAGVGLSGSIFSLLPAFRLPQTCSSGQVAKWDGGTSTWVCTSQPSYLGGAGLSLTGTSFSIYPSYQLPQACAFGQIPMWFGSSWICNTPMTYSAGSTMTQVGGTFDVAAAYQLPQACASGQVAKWNGSAWACAVDAGGTSYTAGTGMSLSGTSFSILPLYQLPQSGCSSGQVVKWTGSGWGCGADLTSGSAPGSWSLTGNAGTSGNFLGTTDNQPLVFKVNGQQVLRLEPNATSPNIIGGYSGNSATVGVSGATISGGGANSQTNLVTDDFGTIGGGSNNQAGDNAGTTSDVPYTTVSGGVGNIASGESATVAGGQYNKATGRHSAIIGGNDNLALGDSETVGGGDQNYAAGNYDFIGGGVENFANGGNAVVGGGDSNGARGLKSVVGGGQGNETFNEYSTIGGGDNNTASGQYSTVPGGIGNRAEGEGSFAAGSCAQVLPNHPGSFVWADSTNCDAFADGNLNPANMPAISPGANTFLVRATGGFYLYSAVDATSDPTGGVRMLAGESGWSPLSDRRLKENFIPVDAQAVLKELAAMPMTTWNFIAQGSGVRHIGPMAQDFHATFGMGASDTSINQLDADGVALASIQGLYQIVQQQDILIQQQSDTVVTLQTENSQQQQQIDDLETRLATLEAKNSGSTAPTSTNLPSPWWLAGGLLVVGTVVRRRSPKGNDL